MRTYYLLIKGALLRFPNLRTPLQKVLWEATACLITFPLFGDLYSCWRDVHMTGHSALTPVPCKARSRVTP